MPKSKLLLDWTHSSAPLEVVRTLRQAGFETYLAGGCVRDLLLGLTPKDHDIATSATPLEVSRVFRRTIPVKPELGVTMVLWDDSRLEVTTFRSEGAYLDGRRPSQIGPADAALDVQRRDFTINGLLLDPETGEVHDYVGGLIDLENRVLRCIRDPYERFGEDHLRILRAVRFAVRFDLQIEAQTWDAMLALAAKTEGLSGERIHEEFSKMEAQGKFAKSLGLLVDSGVIKALNADLDTKLQPQASRQRLLQLVGTDRPSLPGMWVTLLGLPLCSWWEAPRTPGALASLEPPHKSLLDRLRCSGQEVDAATFAWTRWPLCWEHPIPPPSRQAALVRDRSWPGLQNALDRFSSLDPLGWWPEHLTALAGRIPKSPPALGRALMEAGIPKGPLLGEAIREADRLNLDADQPLDAALVAKVAETILGRA